MHVRAKLEWTTTTTTTTRAPRECSHEAAPEDIMRSRGPPRDRAGGKHIQHASERAIVASVRALWNFCDAVGVSMTASTCVMMMGVSRVMI